MQNTVYRFYSRTDTKEGDPSCTDKLISRTEAWREKNGKVHKGMV